MKKKVAINTLSQLLGKAIGSLTALIVSLSIARSLGPTGYGDFTKVATYVGLFFLVADFGLNAIYLQRKSDQLYATLLGLRLGGSILLVAIAVMVLPFLPQGAETGYSPFVQMAIILFAPVIIFQALITTANAVFQEQLRYDLSALALLVGSSVTIVMMVAPNSLSSKYSILYPLFSLLVGSLVTAATSLFFVTKIREKLTLSFDVLEMKQLFISALPLGITLLFNLVYFRFDSFVLAFTRTTSEVGVYGLAYKFFEVPLVLPTFFMNAVYPLMLQKTDFKKIIANSGLFLFVTSLMIVAIFWFGAPFISLIRSDFAPSILPLRILSLSLPFFFLTSVTMWSLIAMKKQRSLISIYGTSMVINILANAFFVPKFGYMAAAWITVVSEGAVLAISSFILVQSLTKEKI